MSQMFKNPKQEGYALGEPILTVSEHCKYQTASIYDTSTWKKLLDIFKCFYMKKLKILLDMFYWNLFINYTG